VVVQGLFGKYTVTLKLYPAVVTLHLLGGLVLLACWRVQHEAFSAPAGAALPCAAAARALVVLALLVLQIALGGWVSTNYAVLACSGFPHATGSGGRPMDAATASRCCANWALPATGSTVLRGAGGHPHGAPRLCRVAAGWLRWPGAPCGGRAGAAPPRARPGGAAAGATGQRPVERGAGLAARGGAGPLRRRRGLVLVLTCCWRAALARSPLRRGARGGPTAGRPWPPRIAHPMAQTLAAPLAGHPLGQYYALTKPRVVQLIVFCAVIGMLLAEPGCRTWRLALAGTCIGIWLVASAAAAFNCLVEQHIDAPHGAHRLAAHRQGQLTPHADAAVLGRAVRLPAARCCGGGSTR
jgi:hypothetical protein